MTFSYLASFDFADRRHGFSTIALTKSPSGTITLDFLTDIANAVNVDGDAIRVVNHYPDALTTAVTEDAEGSTGLRHTCATQSWGALVQQRLRQAASGAGWTSPNTITVAYDSDTMRYTIGYSGGTLTAIAFGNAQTRKLFGFATNFSGSSSSVAGTLTPSFVIQPILDAVTMEAQDGYDYEPGGISQQSVAEYGGVYAFTRAAAPIYRDWTQQSETRVKAIRTSSTALWNHQDLFETCRCVHPFVVIDGFGDGKDYVFRLRPDGCIFSTSVIRRAGGDSDDALFDVVYNAQVLGVFEDDEDEEFSGQLVINGFPVQINGDNNVVING